MSITIEQLDSEYVSEDISILVGKSFILKYTPEKSIFDTNKDLKKLINTDNLLIDPLNTKVKVLIGKTREINDLLSESIKNRESYEKLQLSIEKGDESPIKKYFIKQFLTIKDQIIRKGLDIQNLEKETSLYLASNNNLYFCKECNAYLSDSFESLPSNCLFCSVKTNWGDASNAKTVRFLDTKVTSYLDGLWFEDYIAKLLNRLEWKTWCHGSVMGSSGADHQVDILGVNSSDGRVLVCECKTAKISKEHVFDLSAQFNDINSSFGFLFSLEPVYNERLVGYMKRTAGLCLLDNLKLDSDEKIIAKIEKLLDM